MKLSKLKECSKSKTHSKQRANLNVDRDGMP
jgi:hypothetical protein